jgi:2-deoxy-D-gluconate 3-dehydrogenase
MMDIFSLSGKKAIVTGAGGGLGNKIAQGLAEAGAVVTIVDRLANTDEIAAEMTKDGRIFYGVTADLTDRISLKKSFEESVEKMGGLDILVNNAGMQVRGHAEDIPLDKWDQLIELNLTAAFEMSQLAGRLMIEKKEGGKIVNVASMLSFFGGLNCCPYAASKGAVAQLTKALSNEWAGYGINVNAIAPGYMDTPLNTKLINDPERYKEITLRIPAHRWGTPDDLKGTVVFLCSHAADYVSGAIIPIDGGYLGR